MEVPTAAELLNDGTARQVIDAAWIDSRSDDPHLRHEEGGWIYMDIVTGAITALRATRGNRAEIDLHLPPEIAGSLVVGKFHTHPNPTADGWEPGPSGSDLAVDDMHGVPDLIRADDGIHLSGPPQRRGGLSGNAGYP